MPWYYSPNLDESPIVLDEVESKHAIRSMRKKVGDILTIFNGKGRLIEASIVVPSPKEVHAEFHKELTIRPNPYHLTIAIGLPKKPARWEFFLEKATEIGVQKIIPLLCSRGEKPRVNRSRSERILIQASKQSKHPLLPELTDLCSVEEALSQISDKAHKYMAHCEPSAAKRSLESCYRGEKEVVIFIGPEGDFTQTEIDMMVGASCQPISFGDYILRTETAGIVSCQIIKSLYAQSR